MFLEVAVTWNRHSFCLNYKIESRYSTFCGSGKLILKLLRRQTDLSHFPSLRLQLFLSLWKEEKLFIPTTRERSEGICHCSCDRELVFLLDVSWGCPSISECLNLSGRKYIQNSSVAFFNYPHPIENSFYKIKNWMDVK